MFEKWRQRRAEQRTLDHWPTWGQTPGEMLPQSALAIADVWACVEVLADAAASVPLIVYRRSNDGRERLSSGRLPGLLERPAPAHSQRCGRRGSASSG
jgi:phage portal protein BeeE